MGKLILPYGCKLKLRDSDNVKMFLNNEQIYPTECKIIKGWDTTITLSNIRDGGSYGNCITDFLIFTCGVSYQLKYITNGRTSGSGILKRNGLGVTKQPKAYSTAAIPSGYVLEEDEVRVSVASTRTYANSVYYYASYALGNGVGYNGGSSASVTSYWMSGAQGSGITFTIEDLVPDKFCFSNYGNHNACRANFRADILVKAVSKTTQKEIILMDTSVNIPTPCRIPFPTQFYLPVDLVKE